MEAFVSMFLGTLVTQTGYPLCYSIYKLNFLSNVDGMINDFLTIFTAVFLKTVTRYFGN